MKNNLAVWGLCLGVLSYFGGTIARADLCDTTMGVESDVKAAKIAKICKMGYIPDPFNLDPKMELADGEYYNLVGVVKFISGMPWFQVDLNVHKWLANNKRKTVPFYPVMNMGSNWKQYEGQYVQVLVKAIGRVKTTDSGTAFYSISLAAMGDPKQPQPIKSVK